MEDSDDLDWGEDGPPPGTWSPPLADTGAERTARYDARRRSRSGQVRVSVWVPADRADELRAIAAKLRS